MTKFQTQRKSFTLIEMLVVVVIIGILAGVLVPRLVGARERASDSARIVKVGQISSAVELYAQETGSPYPIATLTGAPGISVATPLVADKIAPYLSTIPTDPGKGTVAIDSPPSNIQVTGDSFAYWTNDAGTGYAITALMESKKGNTTNAVGLIDADKQGGYQVVGKGLTIAYGFGGAPIVGITQVLNDLVISDGTKVYVLMDRNLGATLPGTGEASYGYYYQRGNNFGFWNGLTGYSNQDGSANISTGTMLVNDPSLGYSNSTFVLAPNSPYDWVSGSNSSLRPPAGQGPCPNGYHIPTKDERQGLYDIWKLLPGKSANDGAQFINDFKLPMARCRLNSNGTLSTAAPYGDYWSSSTWTTSSYILDFDLTVIYPSLYVDRRAKGFPIRCFKN